jgi:hypothetical protein
MQAEAFSQDDSIKIRSLRHCFRKEGQPEVDDENEGMKRRDINNRQQKTWNRKRMLVKYRMQKGQHVQEKRVLGH